LTGSDPWSNHAQWTNQNSSGVAACSALGLSCYAVYSTADGSAQTCSASFGAGGGGLALCE